MATSDDYRHVPTSTLCRLAQRLGKVYASASTWFRLVRLHQWRRPRLRVHPPKPKVGIRASKPNEIWHVDTTIIRLLDGTKVYLHAVIDNFSRRILAWKANALFETSATAEILNRAAEGMGDTDLPQVLMDSGVENLNGAVDAVCLSKKLTRVIAQIDIMFANSMIEAWWRALKHNWLYLNQLDSLAAVTRLVGFYVEQHNRNLPHAAFKGQTPDEMYFGTGSLIPEQLKAERAQARVKRIETNRARTCKACEGVPQVFELPTPETNSSIE